MSPSTNAPDALTNESRMGFIPTTTYQRFLTNNGTSQLPVPPEWEQYEHPNGDIYYYHRGLRLITPDNIRDPEKLRHVLDAREDHLQCLDNSVAQLPADWELVLSDVTEEVAVIGMFSRTLGLEYEWTEELGLQVKDSPEYFWSHVAEYPSHHPELPPNTEAAFTQAIRSARVALTEGAVFPFSESQINQIIARYEDLKALQSQGKMVVPALGWLMGAVMPLDALERARSDEELDNLMEKMRF
ncbi:hypothetical protein C0992_010884 [Termitomyces sp. T32_za158]|nr:hypothetical protein C0992_010884 [Termitomyces sp. T32_za158]